MRRILFDKLKLHLDKKEFTILTGARQTGKSTLLRQLEDYCRHEKHVPAVYLTLENKSILAELDKDPLNLLNFLPNQQKRTIVFIDEVQYLQDPSNFLKLLYDEYAGRVKIVASGSSAFYIDKHFNDSLAGRKRIFHLYTCTFDEYLLLSGKVDLLAEIERLRSKNTAKTLHLADLRNEWHKYMLFGGYPAVVTEADRGEKISKLREIRDSYVKRDVSESGVKNDTAFYALFRLLAEQSGCLLNVNELSATLRIKNDTVEHYLAILQKCFHITLVRPFFRNLRKELTKMPKVFLMDSGLRNCLVGNFQPVGMRVDKGDLWEAVYFRMLVDCYGVDEINYWRTTSQNEVDFVLPQIEHPFAVEAKYDEATIKPYKYKIFNESYSDIPLSFAWMEPFDEHFFRRMPYDAISS
ncbi:MAG: ATP-binding protein [Bacteroidales bacterium]|jgi:predicted AAA+ superfamily ATPase|nr:ATP-binding protein [Bacteroidales bacterium]